MMEDNNEEAEEDKIDQYKDLSQSNDSSGSVSSNEQKLKIPIPIEPPPVQKLWMGSKDLANKSQTPIIKKKKLRNYEKIVTNPKDKQYDLESCTSYYLKDYDIVSDEINIRDSIKRCENRKLKAERRRKKQ